MSTASQERHVHHGHNIKKFREMLGIKQEALAIDLGDDWSQKKVSRLEEKEIVEPEILEQVANIFKVPVDAIKNYDSEQAITIISNTFNNEAIGNAFYDEATNEGAPFGTIENYKCNFNPLEKMVELYERMIKQQGEMIEKLERLLKDK